MRLTRVHIKLNVQRRIGANFILMELKKRTNNKNFFQILTNEVLNYEKNKKL